MSSIVVTMTPDEQRLWRAQQKLIAQAKDLDGGYKKVGGSAKKAGKDAEGAGKQQQSFAGGSALRDLGLLAVGYAGVTKAIGLMSAALEESNRIRQEAAQIGMQSAGGLGSLAQLATSAQDAKKLRGLARQTFKEGATGSLDEAANLVFALSSAGALDERETFSSMAAADVIKDPAKMASATAALRTAMGDKETGNLRTIASKAIAASTGGKSSVEDLLEAAARSGVAANALEVSDEELLAATAVVSNVRGAAEAGTQVSALLRSAVKKGEFKGVGLPGILDAIAGKGMTDAELIEYFGTDEAAAAFGTLQTNRGKFAGLLGETGQANTTDRVAQAIGYNLTDETIVNAQLARQAKARRILANEDEGAQENLIQAVLEQSASEKSVGMQGLQSTFEVGSRPVFGALSPFTGEEYRERVILQSFAHQGFAASRDGSFRPGQLADTPEERRLLLSVLRRLEEVGVELSDGAQQWRQAAQQQSDHTGAGRLMAQGAQAQ